ncbi:ribonuclease I [Citrobacter rodentium]|jgi:Ribonuclease I|uniref:Ribonuclease I n=2 Tax=Citrobacter rodentium TaxID=67825 RepID=D2TMQ6_CITRI|nr:ribonuclease I [Citrobacter rodentium]KIQ50938.1 ribonuclease I [Citrobacter rodentium]QBY31839.1 ribonuclease I [Citrobacter rodentium]UHO30807.1 ribonuclease I [Citrobacter rodentium NBRC 105723 = DSM 16636]CBG87401.1 ribonuclease I [Citrobacter rodentium ICC168]HAT8013551.1 ribonuclease I [Citrobacter rodentium NBRC 105723 = DSM 16636]
MKKSLLLAVSLLPLSAAFAAPLQPRQYGDFDRYVLALSWQTGFCQSQHERNRHEPDECRLQKEVASKVDYLTVHGLWPGLPKSVAARGVDERRWMRFGCATRPVPDLPEARASRKCAAPETGLSLESAARLSEVMPGAGGRSCLERYEYAKHGACFGFDPDAYFDTMVRLNKEIKDSELGQFLGENYGKRVSRSAFDAAFARRWGKENIRAVKLSCHGNPAYLTEIQFSLKAEAINAPLSAASFAPQPHPGNCGKQFILDTVGY